MWSVANASNPFNITYSPHRTTSEGFLSILNLMTNQYLMKLFKAPTRTVLPYIRSLYSPITGTNLFKGIIGNLIARLTLSLFPTALAMGFPIMLYILVVEKENKIRSLLEINGVSSLNYWLVNVAYNLILLTVSTLIFLAIGWIWVDTVFFQQVSWIVTLTSLTSWNVAQIGMAVLLSAFIKNATSATCKQKKLKIEKKFFFKNFNFFRNFSIFNFFFSLWLLPDHRPDRHHRRLRCEPLPQPSHDAARPQPHPPRLLRQTALPNHLQLRQRGLLHLLLHHVLRGGRHNGQHVLLRNLLLPPRAPLQRAESPADFQENQLQEE